MKSRYELSIAILGLLVLLGLGCSSDKGEEPVPFDVNAAMQRAWNHFQADDYDDAQAVFSDVIAHDGDNAQAYMGRGWCFAYLAQQDESLYDDARADFGSAISNNIESPDADMGFAAVYRSLDEFYDSAIVFASQVIEADSGYVFSKDMTINYLDAHLIKAYCHFYLGDDHFPQAHIEVNYLCTRVLYPLDSLPDPETFNDDGYERALALKLELLTEQIGPR